MSDPRQAAVEAAARALMAEDHDFADMADATATAQTAIAAYERALWRPIEEAPRDGTRVLVKSGKWIGIAYWQKDPSMWEEEDVPCWAVFECDDCYYSLYLTEQNAPTHFRHLPAGPEGV